MSKKHMRIKRMTIMTLSLVMFVSTLAGCSVVSDKELMEMINAGESITIEYAVPDYESADLQEVADFQWIELDQLQTYNRGFRQSVDEVFNINIVTEAGRNGKNGVLFVDDAGKRNGNAVLADAFNNKVFVEKYWVDAKVKEALAKAANEAYTDLTDTDHDRVLATLNAYYNLFPSDEENEAGLSDYLTRGEYLSGLYRVFNGVQDGLIDAESVSAKVGGKTSHTRFLPSVEGISYLKTTNNSLDESTYKGAISRIEGIYTIIQALSLNNNRDGATNYQDKIFTDAKSGGDLTSKLGFAGKQRAESYTLAYMLKNPDKGLQEELYRALVVAKEQGIITSNESRWDEPLTRGEALDMIVNGLIAKSRLTGYVINTEYGEMELTELPDNTTVEESESTESDAVEIGVVAIDPNTRPSDVHDETYGQIWKYVDESYKESLRAGMSKKEALEMADVFASIFGTSVEDLNKIKGYDEVGYQRPVATKPSTTNNPKPSNPSTPSTPPPVVESEPKYPISEHGYAITPEDKNGDGILDFLEESYIKSDSTVSVPSGTPNPLTMP